MPKQAVTLASKAKKKKTHPKKKTRNHILHAVHSDDSSNLCGACHINYYDVNGKVDEWIECTAGKIWFHLSCSGVLGDGYDFVCIKCSDGL